MFWCFWPCPRKARPKWVEWGISRSRSIPIRCIMCHVTSYIERIADEWRQRSPELAQWTMTHLVNRTDVWGRYLAKKHRTTKDGVQNNAITAPFRDERGKVFLNCRRCKSTSRLARWVECSEFIARAPTGRLAGLRSTLICTTRGSLGDRRGEFCRGQGVV